MIKHIESNLCFPLWVIQRFLLIIKRIRKLSNMNWVFMNLLFISFKFLLIFWTQVCLLKWKSKTFEFDQNIEKLILKKGENICLYSYVSEIFYFRRVPSFLPSWKTFNNSSSPSSLKFYKWHSFRGLAFKVCMLVLLLFVWKSNLQGTWPNLLVARKFFGLLFVTSSSTN